MACSCTVLPTTTLLAGGVTSTVATTSGVTVIALWPLCPSAVAVMVADPTRTPPTRPSPFTVAVAPSLVVQVTGRPVSTVPLAARSTGCSWTVPPSSTDALRGTTSTVATASSDTVIVALPLTPSALAVITASPIEPAVTRPALSTPATAALFEDHATTRPVMTPPAPSRVVASNVRLSPGRSVAVGGVTTIEAMAGPVTFTAAWPLRPSAVAVIVV